MYVFLNFTIFSRGFCFLVLMLPVDFSSSCSLFGVRRSNIKQLLTCLCIILLLLRVLLVVLLVLLLLLLLLLFSLLPGQQQQLRHVLIAFVVAALACSRLGFNHISIRHTVRILNRTSPELKQILIHIYIYFLSTFFLVWNNFLISAERKDATAAIQMRMAVAAAVARTRQWLGSFPDQHAHNFHASYTAQGEKNY